MFSKRLVWDSAENALAGLARAGAGDAVDLTESNPTRVGLDYPTDALRAALASADPARYEPAPLGLPAARAAVAQDYARDGLRLDPEQVVLTASSSESYGLLFKLLADPGDAVLVPEPSYPLFDYLSRLEGVVPIGYRLAFDGAWHIDFASLLDALDAARVRQTRPRAVVVVSPNNPTGSFLKRDELSRLAAICADAEMSLIADEVFSPYAIGTDGNRVRLLAAEADLAGAVPAFSLGGLSKSCGLPQLKLGWIAVGGRDVPRTRAALELLADTYLSVGGPVQAALPRLFEVGRGLRAAIAARVAENRARLAAALSPPSPCTLLPAEGGWSAILRVPSIRSDEAWAASLLAEAKVLVHPGYFYDLTGGTFLVASLLPQPGPFAEAVARLVALVNAETS